jgi:uncharacterized protein
MMLSRIGFVASTIGSLLFYASGAQAQSFNCRHGETAGEVLICQTPRLSSLNQEMSYLVLPLRESLPARERRVLDAEQHSWRRSLVTCGKDVDCIADRYGQRIHQLLTVECLRAGRCSRW